MAYEIVGETIKSATSIKIGDIFKVASTNQQGQTTYTYPKRYKENITKQTYPNFHIIQVSVNATNNGLRGAVIKHNLYKQRVQLDYLINVQYRVAENTENISNLRQQLDAVGLKLCAELTELDLELPTKTKNRNYEIVDGVVQMFFNITVFANPELANIQKMEELSIVKELKGG